MIPPTEASAYTRTHLFFFFFFSSRSSPFTLLVIRETRPLLSFDTRAEHDIQIQRIRLKYLSPRNSKNIHAGPACCLALDVVSFHFDISRKNKNIFKLKARDNLRRLDLLFCCLLPCTSSFACFAIWLSLRSRHRFFRFLLVDRFLPFVDAVCVAFPRSGIYFAVVCLGNCRHDEKHRGKEKTADEW